MAEETKKKRTAKPRVISDAVAVEVRDASNLITDLDVELEESRPDVPEVLNILPLRESVIYPMLIAPLSVSREQSILAIDDSLSSSDRVIGVLTQREPLLENPEIGDLYDVGCAVIIRTLVKMPDATRLIVQGLTRFKVVELLQTEPYLRVRIEPIAEPATPEGKEEEVEALRRSISAMFDQAVRLTPSLPDELRSLTQAVEEPNVMADLVAAHLCYPPPISSESLRPRNCLSAKKRSSPC